MHALLTIHDVMPESLEKVKHIVSILPDICRQHLAMLVVPGKDWQPEQLQQLRQWQAEGFVLAGHGWSHRVREYNGLYHKLHALLLSRSAGEHLPLSEQEILNLMQRCHDWFGEHELKQPDYYVPPAWALGFVDKHKLKDLPWRYLEVTGGMHDLYSDEFRRLPVCGFEADTRFRAGFLTTWNRLQAGLSSSKRPLRLSLHPDDPQLRVAPQMHRFLQQVSCGRDYHSLFSD